MIQPHTRYVFAKESIVVAFPDNCCGFFWYYTKICHLGVPCGTIMWNYNVEFETTLINFFTVTLTSMALSYTFPHVCCPNTTRFVIWKIPVPEFLTYFNM